MESGKINDTLVSIQAAWLCAAERDIEREEEERAVLVARQRRRGIKGTYELDTAAQLDADLKKQELLLRQRKQDRLSVERDYNAKGSTRSRQDSPQHQQRSTKLQETASIYQREHQRLATLLKEKPIRRKNQLQPRRKKAHPRFVDDMLAIERRYTRSAILLQMWWRFHLRRQFWRSYLRQVRAAVQIQRMIRGFVCRHVFRVWHRNRTYRAILIQAAYRGYYMRRVLVTWRQWEYVNIARIQGIVRGHFGKKEARLRRRSIAVLRIQCLWRGWTSRRRTDLLWLSTRAIELQRLIRGVLTRKRVRRRQAVFTHSAIQIQRMFRGVLARKWIHHILYDRETRNRQDFMLVLEAEEEWHRAQCDRYQARLQRFRLFEQLVELEEQYYRAHDRVNDLEAIYLDMQTQRIRVSPRAIEQGWVEEMEHKMREQRRLITETKLRVFFDLGFRLKKKEEEYYAITSKIRVLEEKRLRFQIWRDEEFLDYWQRECDHQHQHRMTERRRRIADQKRRWRVHFHHLSGKCDRRWRGTHWSPDVLEKAKEKEIFSLSKTNLLATIEAKWRKHLEHGARDLRDDDEQRQAQRRHELEEEVALTTATAQIEQTKAIFDPVFRDIEGRFLLVKEQQQRQEQKRAWIQKQNAKRDISLSRQTTVEDTQTHRPAPSPERQMKIRRNQQNARVPWHLLDELVAERRRLEEEKAMFNVWGKVHVSMKVKRQAPDK